MACLIALLAPAYAHAATASLGSGTLTFSAGWGETNNVVVSGSSGTYTITDSGATISAGSGCSSVNANQVTCSGIAFGASVTLLDMADTFTSTSTLGVTVDGGDNGDDLSGGPSSDTLRGGDNVDTLNGGAGDDSLDGGPLGDTLNGGDGSDTADYSARTNPVTVTLDGTAGDGEAAEGDNVATDVENVRGGSASDTLTGSALANNLSGNGGNDTLSGGAGGDEFDGGAGADTISGGADRDKMEYSGRVASVTVSLDGTAGDGESGENDNVHADVEHVDGGLGSDTLTGNADANSFDGDSGNDTLNGAGGADDLQGQGGADVLNGGAGVDRADYDEKLFGITVTLDGVANDGGDNDNVGTDVENVRGGTGSDTITGSASPNHLDGGSGGDTLNGGEGDDTLVGQNGSDALNGGGGSDRVDYSAKTAAVTVALDGAAGDGTSGENDTVAADVENVTGGSANDTITGSADANSLVGAGGDDTLEGGAGIDAHDGGAGADTILARDSVAEAIVCGADTDAATVDPTDTNAGCETFDTGASGGGDGGGTGGDGGTTDPTPGPGTTGGATDGGATGSGNAPPPALAGLDSAIPATVTATGDSISVTLSCPASASGCRGTITLVLLPGGRSASVAAADDVAGAARRSKRPRTKRRIVLGKADYSLEPGESKAVPVRLARRGRKAVRGRRKGRFTVRVKITGSDAEGRTTRSTHTLTVRASRRGGGKNRGRRSRAR